MILNKRRMTAKTVLTWLCVGVSALITIPRAGDGLNQQGRLWTIAVGHDWGAHEYIDTDGYIRGFTRDLIEAVCKAGDMRCRTVWDVYTNCWDSEAGQHSSGGEGLMERWYDACAGYVPLANRMQVFDFSMSFLQRSDVFFYVKRGSEFNVNDISGARAIGFMDGWFSDEKCLARITSMNKSITGSKMEKKKIKHYNKTDAAVADLLDGKINAMFTTDFIWDNPDIVKAGNATVFSCSTAGQAMMTRKDNDFNSYWNAAFQQLVSSGKFSQLCETSMASHAHIGDLTPCI